jgi:hypothetical protein
MNCITQSNTLSPCDLFTFYCCFFCRSSANEKLKTVPDSLDKMGGGGCNFLFIKIFNLDGIFFPIFCLTNPALYCYYSG